MWYPSAARASWAPVAPLHISLSGPSVAPTLFHFWVGGWPGGREYFFGNIFSEVEPRIFISEGDPFPSYIYRLLYFFYSKIRNTSLKKRSLEINGAIIGVIMGPCFPEFSSGSPGFWGYWGSKIRVKQGLCRGHAGAQEGRPRVP